MPLLPKSIQDKIDRPLRVLEGASLNWCFDCDGVICDTEGTNYGTATPRKQNIEKINKLYDNGYHITVFTGRGSVSGIDWRDVTEKQFRNWGVKYHELVFGKPPFDMFVDDHAWNVKDFEEGKI